MSYAATFKRRLANITKDMANHVLTPDADTPNLKSFWFREPGTTHLSAYIVFAPTGITITGDVLFGDHQGAHAPYVGLGWFVGMDNRSWDYVVGKFFRREYLPDFAREDVEAWIADGESKATSEDLDDIDWESGMAAYGQLVDLGFDLSDGMPGEHYCPKKATMLLAIQRAFSWQWRQLQQRRAAA